MPLNWKKIKIKEKDYAFAVTGNDVNICLEAVNTLQQKIANDILLCNLGISVAGSYFTLSNKSNYIVLASSNIIDPDTLLDAMSGLDQGSVHLFQQSPASLSVPQNANEVTPQYPNAPQCSSAPQQSSPLSNNSAALFTASGSRLEMKPKNDVRAYRHRKGNPEYRFTQMGENKNGLICKLENNDEAERLYNWLINEIKEFKNSKNSVERSYHEIYQLNGFYFSWFCDDKVYVFRENNVPFLGDDDLNKVINNLILKLDYQPNRIIYHTSTTTTTTQSNNAAPRGPTHF